MTDKKHSLLIRYLSWFYGEVEDDRYYASARWEMGSIFALILSGLYWPLLTAMSFAQDVPASQRVITFSILKVSLLSMIGGFILSSFTGFPKDDRKRTWAMFLGTVGLPGSLIILSLAHVIAGCLVLTKGLLKFQNGLLFVQDMLGGGLSKKWDDRQKRKRLEQDAKLKKQAEKVRVSGNGYRMAHAACNECGQVLPENGVEDDRRTSSSSAG